MDDDDEAMAQFVHRSTSVRWTRGDFALDICLDTVLAPEAIETVLTRTRREFVAGARQLNVVPDTEDATDG